MNEIVQRYAESAFVLLVTGAALIWPPLALFVAAGFFIFLAVVVDKRSEPPK